MNIVNPIEAYDSGVCSVCALLTRNDSLVNQLGREVAQRILPDEMELLLFRQVQGAGGPDEHDRLRDIVNAFRGNVREEIQSNCVSGRGPDCVDSIASLVGHPNLAGVGSAHSWRHYRWAFNRTIVTGRKYGRDVRDSTSPINPKDVALTARYDQVKAICAKMVERNPVVIR